MTEWIKTPAIFNRIFSQLLSSLIHFKRSKMPGTFVKFQYIQGLGTHALPFNSLRKIGGLRVCLANKINITPIGGQAENLAGIKKTGMLPIGLGNSHLLS